MAKKEKLNDLALMTGATVINEDLGDDMDLISVDHLGKANENYQLTLVFIPMRGWTNKSMTKLASLGIQNGRSFIFIKRYQFRA